MNELKLSSVYYDDKKYYYAISHFMKKSIVKVEVRPPENFYEAVFGTRSFISDEYDKRVFLRTEPLTKEVLDMIKSKDSESIQLGVQLLLSSKKPADQGVYNDLYETLTILTNIYALHTNSSLIQALLLWVYLCDVCNFEKRYLSNMSSKYTVCYMDIKGIEFK